MKLSTTIDVDFDDLSSVREQIRFAIMNHDAVKVSVKCEDTYVSYEFIKGDVSVSCGYNTPYVKRVEDILGIKDFRRENRNITLNMELPDPMFKNAIMNQINDLLARHIAPNVYLLPKGVKTIDVAAQYVMNSIGASDNVGVNQFNIDIDGFTKPYAIFDNPAGVRLSCNVPAKMLPVERFDNLKVKPVIINHIGDPLLLGLYIEQ